MSIGRECQRFFFLSGDGTVVFTSLTYKKKIIIKAKPTQSRPVPRTADHAQIESTLACARQKIPVGTPTTLNRIEIIYTPVGIIIYYRNAIVLDLSNVFFTMIVDKTNYYPGLNRVQLVVFFSCSCAYNT